MAVFAFLLYRSTLLAGVDFGDTGSFQAAIGDLNLSPRQAYPLYFALGNLVAWLAGGEPAFGLNLFSAIAGALAAGVLTLIACELTGSLAAGRRGRAHARLRRTRSGRRRSSPRCTRCTC